MSKSLAIGRHASSSSGCRHTRSVRVWTQIHQFLPPRRPATAASPGLPPAWLPKDASPQNHCTPRITHAAPRPGSLAQANRTARAAI